MEMGFHTLLILCCVGAGTALGFRMFALAKRDERTILPSAWQPAMAVATGMCCGLMAWRYGLSWELPALLALPLFGVLLSSIDLRSKLLPNALVLRFFVTAAGLLIPAAVLGDGWSALLGAVIGGLTLFTLYLVLALISPSGLGMGDVKLAGVLGMYSGYAGPATWIVTALGGFVIGGALGLLLLVFARSSLKATIPFGPAMFGATMAAFMCWA